MANREKDQKYALESSRIALLPEGDQMDLLAMYRGMGANPIVPKANQKDFQEKADALANHLRKLTKRIPKKRRN